MSSQQPFDPYDEKLYGDPINTFSHPDLIPTPPPPPPQQSHQSHPTQLQPPPSPLLSPHIDHPNHHLQDHDHHHHNNKSLLSTALPNIYSTEYAFELDTEEEDDEDLIQFSHSIQSADELEHLASIEAHLRKLSALLNSPMGSSRTAYIQRAFDIFRHLDVNNVGLLTLEQLDMALSSFGSSHQFSRSEIEEIFSIASTHEDGFLRFADFYSIFACLTLLWGKFGADTNFLTPDQVKSALSDAGIEIHNAQLEHMFVTANEPDITDSTDPNNPSQQSSSSSSPSSSSSSSPSPSQQSQPLSSPDQIHFPQLLQIYIDAPRSEGDLFLVSWYKAGKTNFLHHRQHLEASPTQDFVAGTAAGIALTLVGHPFDTIKVRMQTGGFSNPVSCIQQTIAREGPLAVYKGMGGPMLTIPAINAIVFTCYSQAQSIFRRINGDPNKELSLLQITLAGMYAGLLNCVVACPVELVKTRLQIQYGEKGSFKGPVDCIQHILKASGPKGLFRGMSATIYRELPGYGGQFFAYEWCKRFCMKNGRRSEYELTPVELLMSGGVAGLAGWVCSYPMDYIKSQIQAEPWNKKSRYKKHPFLFDGGFFSCLQTTVKRHGAKELWKGFSVCAARGFPANAAGFLAYETSLAALRDNQLFISTKQTD